MTGVELIIDGDASAVARYRIPPAARGLQALHLMRASAEFSARNWALGGVGDAEVVGNIPAAAGYVSCRGQSAFLQTSLAEATNMTFYTAAKTGASLESAAEQPMFFGTYVSPSVANPAVNSYGIGQYVSAAADIRGICCRFASDGVTRSSTPSIIADGSYRAQWSLYVLTVSAAQTVLRDLTHGLTGTTTTGTRDPSSGLFRVGSGQTTLGGPCQLAWWQAHTAVHTEAEIQANATWIRQDLAQVGITV